jgi:hypothetical protein
MPICYVFWGSQYKCLRINVAEGVRFELTRPFGLPVFKTSAINRSATPPEIDRAPDALSRETSSLVPEDHTFFQLEQSQSRSFSSRSISDL